MNTWLTDLAAAKIGVDGSRDLLYVVAQTETRDLTPGATFLVVARTLAPDVAHDGLTGVVRETKVTPPDVADTPTAWASRRAAVRP